MNEEVKVKWVAALRSGEYQQGQDSLRTYYLGVEQFCCLGVLCDLHARETGKHWSSDVEANRFKYDGEEELLPRSVAAWAGLDTSPVIQFGGQPLAITEVNDGGESFLDIADAIEGQL